MRYIFARLSQKQKLLGFLRKFSKIFKSFSRRLQNCISWVYFSKKTTNHALYFCALGRKTQIVGKFWEIFDEISIEKLNFYFFIFSFKNLLLKIELSEITPFSTTIFSVSGWFPPFPPAYALDGQSVRSNWTLWSATSSCFSTLSPIKWMTY